MVHEKEVISSLKTEAEMAKKTILKITSSLFFSFLVGFLSSTISYAAAGDKFLAMPVQDGGRIKPYDTFAREMLQLVYGKTSYEGRDAAEIVFTWMLTPEAWKQKQIFEVKNHQVLEALQLADTKRKLFTGEELFGSSHFSNLRTELQEKRESKEKLSPYFQALQRLENQFFVFQSIATGEMLKVVPAVAPSTAWVSVAQMSPEFQELFLKLTKVFIEKLGQVAANAGADQIAQTQLKLDEAVQQFTEAAKKQNPEAYVGAEKTDFEVLYNHVHPFRVAYVFYLITALILLFVWITKKQAAYKVGLAFLGLGFLIHTLGFAARIYLAERPPVSNMYETVIWVSWGGVLFSMVLEYFGRTKLLVLAGALAGLFALIVADNAPAVLDPTIQPLEAVLRSNFWLTTHVMTITISYAAFMLAFVLGDIGVFYFMKGELDSSESIKTIVNGIYRAIQIGVAFLAPGIILGGVWADYSWGRFWGWDPKETWALIALLGYVAVLHGRLAGLLKQFGMVASAVITFSLVIMAWYGVNYVLGAGLHSYGFGAGGLEYVSAFVLLHVVFVAYVGFFRKSALQRQMPG